MLMTDKFEKLNIWLSKYKKKNVENQHFLYNCETTGRMEVEFSLNNGPKRTENMPG